MKLVWLISLSLLGVAVSEDWHNFRTTWGLVPGISGFNPQPRIQREAEDDDFVQISACGDGSSVVDGNRYIKSESENKFVVIYDKNGYVAGIQSVVPAHVAASSPDYDFEQSEFYLKDTILGEEVYLLTAFFVEPSTICTVGRTAEEFEEQGTGYMLAFMRGESTDNYLNIALQEDEALDDGNWYEHKCFLNMGNHYFNFDKTPDQDCQTVHPFQVVYSRGRLNAFVFQHQVSVPGDVWERPDLTAINFIVEDPPQCLVDAADQGQLTTMHVYVRNYLVLCT